MKAAELYRAVDWAPDQIHLWTFDSEARCRFLLGETERALGCYDDLYWCDHGLDETDLAIQAQAAQDEGRHEDALVAYDEMISRCERLRVDHPTLDPLVYRERWFSGCSEGYIRKYVSLVALGRETEAEDLLGEYRRRYETEVLLQKPVRDAAQ